MLIFLHTVKFFFIFFGKKCQIFYTQYKTLHTFVNFLTLFCFLK